MQPQNSITRDDIGKRISAQFELPNGFIREVVGRLDSYDEGAETYFVRTKDDEIVRVPERGIRFGKVIPEPQPGSPASRGNL